MGVDFYIITFQSKEIRDELINKRWPLGWFEELKPWNRQRMKDLILACYDMPLKAWNNSSFRAIGSKWGHYIEVDDNTLKQKSYEKGKS